MDINKAIKILDDHNKWRRGLMVEMKHSPKEIGESIDLILEQVKNYDSLDSLPDKSEQLSDFIHWIAESNMMESSKTFDKIIADYLIR